MDGAGDQTAPPGGVKGRRSGLTGSAVSGDRLLWSERLFDLTEALTSVCVCVCE